MARIIQACDDYEPAARLPALDYLAVLGSAPPEVSTKPLPLGGGRGSPVAGLHDAYRAIDALEAVAAAA